VIFNSGDRSICLSPEFLLIPLPKNEKALKMKEMQNLLNQVAIINKKNAEILDATGGRFNIFRVCGVNHYENIHSAIIAEFLNPNGMHGLKSKLLECFIEVLKRDFKIEPFICKNALVRTEVTTNEGRIDILIEDKDKNKAIIIENKIYAEDQDKQLIRYNDYALKKYEKGNYQILYLSLWGNEPSEQSCKGIEYITISHKETIINWLEKCVSIVSRFPLVRETIIQYINHLKQLTNQDMDTKNKEEIVEFLAKSEESINAAFAISQNIDNVKKHLINKILLPQLKEICKELGLDCAFKEVKEINLFEKYAGFEIYPDWDNHIILAQFQDANLRDLVIGIFDNTNDSWLEKKRLPEFQNWNTLEAMIAIKNGIMAEFFKKEIEEFSKKEIEAFE